MRVGRKCEIKAIYSLEATKSPDVSAPTQTGVILIHHVTTCREVKRSRSGSAGLFCGFCCPSAEGLRKGALAVERLVHSSNPGGQRRRQVDIMLSQISGPEPAAPLPPSFLFSACKCIHCMCSHSPQNVHIPDYPEGFCTLLTFASFRGVLVWLINLAQ